jgi:hypothetical protein
MESMSPTELPEVARSEAPTSSALFWPLVLAAGLLAGAASWKAGEFALERFAPTLELTREQAASRALADAELRRQRRQSGLWIASFTYGVLGGALGVVLGAAGGVARRSLSTGLAGAAAGLIVGGATAAGAAILLVPIYRARLETAAAQLTHDLGLPLLIHGGIWIPVGIAGGLALGMGLGGWRTIVRAITGGAMGALLGTLVYEFAGAVVFPTAETMHPISLQPASRLLAHLCVAILTAAGAAFAVSAVSARKPRSAVASGT